MSKDLRLPLMASLDLTYKCNLRCKSCNAWRISKGEDELNTEEWKNVVDQLIHSFSMRFFRLVGGEPFLYPSYKDIVHYIKAKSCKLTIVTNGTLIDEETAHFLVSEHVDRIRISINGLRKFDDFYRGEGAFAKTKRAIQMINQEKKLRSSNTPKIEIHPFVSRVNEKEMNRLLSFARQFETEFNWHFMRGTIAQEFSRTVDPGFPEDSNKPSVLSVQEKKDFEKKFAPMLTLSERVLNLLYTKIADLPVLSDCARTAYHILIDPWGYIFPCEHIYSYCYGSCKNRYIEEIWSSRKRSILRYYIRKGALDKCHVCGHRRFMPPIILSRFFSSKSRVFGTLDFAYEEKASSS